MIRIHTEFEALNAVMVHRPGAEIDRLAPSNLKELLFEDVPYHEKMMQEHDDFVTIIREESNAEVHYFSELFSAVLKNKARKQELIDWLYSISELSIPKDELSDTPEKALAEMLLSGLTRKEAKAYGYTFHSTATASSDFLLTPIPNMYFSRDPAAAIGQHLLSSNMFYPARDRESGLVRFVLNHHPIFDSGEKSNIIRLPKEDKIEGGDVLVLSDRAIAIGRSERTLSSSIKNLALKLFSEPECTIERVYEVQIPKNRYYMHLDTVFTVVGPETIVAFPDVLNVFPETIIHHKDFKNGKAAVTSTTKPLSFIQFLREEFGKDKLVLTGNGQLNFAEREQISDGTNVFAVGPNKVITYERNKHTNDALRSAGVEVIEFSGSELVRGLGGPRCMTFPFRRGNLK